MLRQQIKPTHRVHGIVSGKDWAPNGEYATSILFHISLWDDSYYANGYSLSVIPDYAKMHWIVRAPTWAELVALRERVKACFE